MILNAGDINWALDLAERCYKRELDRDAWRKWIIRNLENPNFLILRGDHSIVVAAMQPKLPDFVEWEGMFPYWMSDGSECAAELVALFRGALRWMKNHNVRTVWLKPTTGVDASPLAKVLGFQKSYPSFSKDLCDA